MTPAGRVMPSFQADIVKGLVRIFKPLVLGRAGCLFEPSVFNEGVCHVQSVERSFAG